MTCTTWLQYRVYHCMVKSGPVWFWAQIFWCSILTFTIMAEFLWMDQFMVGPHGRWASVVDVAVFKFHHVGTNRAHEWLLVAPGGDIGFIRLTKHFGIFDVSFCLCFSSWKFFT